MGLFNKKKQEDFNAINDIPMPVEDTSESIANLRVPVSENVNLAAPPIPGGTLFDIKNQVSQSDQSYSPVPSMPSVQELPDVPNMNMPEEPILGMPSVAAMEDTDSLFDFSELDTQLEKEERPSNSEAVVELPSESSITSSTVSNINFVEDDKYNDETYFVTTTQFKSLLEIIDSVKSKVKAATQTHLKLLDIKSEEDIEYENLRKDFQFIEEKLYEVDSLVFDKK